ncbi:MAG: RidA family protein [Actinobacteria bacterium]|nr:RidA family protein [Actinomycetota bacterium]
MTANSIARYITEPTDGTAPLYAGAVCFGGLVITTQIPEHADGSVETGDITSQAEVLFDNLERQLAEAGSGLERLLHVTIYLTDMADRLAFNEVYRRRVPQPVPGRCAVEVSALAVPGMRVEITAMAAARA